MTESSDLGREIQIAREIQMSTLPDFMPDVPGYDVAGTVTPMDDTGGDTFDLCSVDNGQVFVLLADATGHGIGPALSALQVQSMLRVALRLGASLDQALQHVNDQLVEDLPDGRFVTACFGLLDPSTHQFHFHAAGQGPILHYHAAGEQFEWFEPECFPMGFLEYAEDYAARTLNFAPGDILALISDGIYEYENAVGELFGTEGVASVIKNNLMQNMTELVETMDLAAREFSGQAPQQDDITIVFVKRNDQRAGKHMKSEFSRSLTSLPEILEFTGQFFEESGVEPSLRFAVDLATEELFTNMVKFNAEADDKILIEFTQVENGLSVSLTDHELNPFDVTQVEKLDITKSIEQREPGGMGLHLVREMVDTFDYAFADGCATVTFTKHSS